MSYRCGFKSWLPCLLAVRPQAHHTTLSLSFPICRVGMLKAHNQLSWCWGFEMMCGKPRAPGGPHRLGVLGPSSTSVLTRPRAKDGSLSSSLDLALWADPRDFCEDSWPLAEDKFSFWSLDRCGMRPVSVSLAGILCGVGVGHERKMALRSPGPMVCTSHWCLFFSWQGTNAHKCHPHSPAGGGWFHSGLLGCPEGEPFVSPDLSSFHVEPRLLVSSSPQSWEAGMMIPFSS